MVRRRTKRTTIWRRIRVIWVTLGITATVVFAVWSLLAFRASADAREALRGGGGITVTGTEGLIGFVPAGAPRNVGLIFFAGALVDPVAYAPLTRAVAEAGFPAYLVALPRRGAFGGADDPQLDARADSILGSAEGRAWVVGGHSRGGVVASTIAARRPSAIAGLVLIGTSHPRDVNLSSLEVPVAKIVGTHDGLASPEEVRANDGLLPQTTDWTWVEGGNHSQFGWYGFQPGDRRAGVARTEQQQLMIAAVIDALERVSAAGIRADSQHHSHR